MGSLTSFIIGAVQLVAGAVLLFTGAATGLGVKLLLSGALTLISAALASRAGRGGFKSSPTYGFDNLSNAATEGSPIPIVYGEHQVAPAIISVNLKTEGGKQVLYVLCAVSEGPVSSIHTVRLNDTPIEAFAGAVATTDRLGTASQTAIPDFNQVGLAYDIGTQLAPRSGSEAAASHTYEMKAEADELVLPLVFGGGLYKIDDSGDVKEAQATFFVEWKQIGEADSKYAAISPGTEDKDEWKLDGTKAGTWSTWKKTQAAYRTQIRLRFDGKSGRPAKGRYVVRIKNDNTAKSTHVRTATLASVIEVSNDGRTYANVALLGLKLPASEQLSGSIPLITCICKGRTLFDPRTSGTAWSQNPVLAAMDLLTNTRYGLGSYLAVGDLDAGVGGSWRTAADACDAAVTPPGAATTEPKWQLDYVVDVRAPASDHLQQMLQTCRMTIVGTDKILCVQDKAGASARSFEGRLTAAAANRRNIVDGPDGRSTLTARRLDASQRWNLVRLQYVDRSRSWKKRIVEVRDTYINVGAIAGGSFAVGDTIKGTTSKAIGRLTATYANGAAFLTYVQDDGGTAFQSGETITDLTTGASATSSSAPYSATPERPLEVQMFGITRRSQAVREARYHLNRARSTPVFAQWSIFLGDLDILPGDVVDVSADFTAWTSKAFTVLSCGFNADGLGVIEAREYSADVYSDSLDTTQLDIVSFKPGGSVPTGLRTPPPGQGTSGAGAAPPANSEPPPSAPAGSSTTNTSTAPTTTSTTTKIATTTQQILAKLFATLSR